MGFNNLINTQKDENLRKVAIVGIYDGYNVTEEDCIRSLDELENLVDTAGGVVIARVMQAKSAPDVRTFIGSGKTEELARICEDNDIDLVVVDDELSPSQIRNLEDQLKVASVIDRSMLILDIFARRAVTNEGRLQVELAQLRYTAPRLVGKNKELSRQGATGGNPIGTRGPGETKLEIERRRIRERITALQREIDDLARVRATMRRARDESRITRVSIVGYTNAGKSTILNLLTGAGILTEDKLFATLDPTTRKFKLPSGTEILLTDTVGFIRRLPHHLISAFRSTLEEAVMADVLMIIIDASDPEYSEHLEVTEKLLLDLGAKDKPTLYVFNKCDLSADTLPHLPSDKKAVYISAKTGEGVDNMIAELENIIRTLKHEYTFVLPPSAASLLSKLYRTGEVLNTEYLPDGSVCVKAVADEATAGQLSQYIKTN